MALTIQYCPSLCNDGGAPTHFTRVKMPILKLPSDQEVWKDIKDEIAAELQAAGIQESLADCLELGEPSRAQAVVDQTMQMVVNIIHCVFDKKKRNC